MAIMSEKELINLNRYFMATNYLSVAQIYLKDNALLKRELSFDDLKTKPLGHFGTAPGQNFIYTHLNRLIKKYDLNMIYISGPGHGGQAMIANSYLEEVYSSFYPHITLDEQGINNLCKEFSYPGGVSSHVAPTVPGSINEGGELGYSLAHAYGAVLDNPDLIAACVIGDGEAETGPLMASYNINRLIDPKTDGIVIPFIHLNGYKIANPTVLGRMKDKDLLNLFKGLGYKPYIVNALELRPAHLNMAETLEKVYKDILNLKKGKSKEFPLVILKSMKGWGCPKKVHKVVIENSFRSHQVPFKIETEKDLVILEKWLKSYKPENLFDEEGKLFVDIKNTLPAYEKRMSNNVHANGGTLLKDLVLPNFEDYKVDVKPGVSTCSPMKTLAPYIRDVVALNNNFRIFGPDEASSNRLDSVFEVTGRKWNYNTFKNDELLQSDGKVIDSILSEHVCQGLLEGYILTGRHGFMHSYEAFIRIIDSMASQHAKWLKVCNELSWRAPIASLNYLLTSHTWEQDHNGFTHQDPGFLNHVVTKKADTSRIYLPVDANTLLSTFDHVLKSKNYINVVVSSKHDTTQYFNMDDAKEHCKKGLGELYISDKCDVPDLILASAGDVATTEIVEAKKILSKFLKIKIRVVNVIDLMRLQSDEEHPHGLSNKEYDAIFTKNKPIIFNFHGYPNLIHMLTYKRTNKNLHVHGYNEEGTITTAFDMRVQNKTDRYNLVLSAIKYLKISKKDEKEINDYCNRMLAKHHDYIRKYGIDMPNIDN